MVWAGGSAAALLPPRRSRMGPGYVQAPRLCPFKARPWTPCCRASLPKQVLWHIAYVGHAVADAAVPTCTLCFAGTKTLTPSYCKYG